MQGAGNGPLSDGAELRAYLAAKLLWDPHADVKRHMREFLQGVYGGAAQAMARYWKLQQRVTDHAFPNDGLDSRYLTPQLLTEGRRLLREADQVASPKARKLIQRHLLSLDYIEAMRARRFHVVGSQYESADTQAQSKVTAKIGRAHV